MQTKIKVSDKNSGEILWEGPMEELDKAYDLATQWERNGLEVEINTPTITSTLAESLGVAGDRALDFQESVQEELEAHQNPSQTDQSIEKIQ